MTSKEKREKIAELREKQQAAAGAKSVGLGAAQECFAAKIRALENGASVRDVEENWGTIRHRVDADGVATPADDDRAADHDTYEPDDRTLAERMAEKRGEELVAGGERDEGSEVVAVGGTSSADRKKAGFKTEVADSGEVREVLRTEPHKLDTPKIRQVKENLQSAKRHQENSVDGQLGGASIEHYRTQLARLATGDDVDVHGFDEDEDAEDTGGGAGYGVRPDGGSSADDEPPAPGAREGPPRKRVSVGRDEPVEEGDRVMRMNMPVGDGPAWLTKKETVRVGRPRLLDLGNGETAKIVSIKERNVDVEAEREDDGDAGGGEKEEVELAAAGADDPYKGREVVLSSREKAADRTEDRLVRDTERYNSAVEGTPVAINTSGGRQPVDPTHNYQMEVYYPSEVVYEHRLNLRVMGQAYRAYSAGAAGGGDHTHSVTHGAPDHQHVLSNVGQDASLGKTEGPDQSTFDGHQHVFGVDATLDSTKTKTTTSDASGDHTHTPDPGIIETFDTWKEFHPHNCDVLINGTSQNVSLRSAVGNQLGETRIGQARLGRPAPNPFTASVDIRGQLTEGQVNTIEVTSETLGHITAFVEGDCYRQILGEG